ncbi:hypothetical protein PIB30_023922 [Stylosanthes scabra]|uniref:Uncharacterized protein n=1 Tax=Stylosanthes scabra TaxID=79078 RepID=A0ABU6VCM6_9FABA|nr:hypothetical protein [Stylosanthes scabra]
MDNAAPKNIHNHMSCRGVRHDRCQRLTELVPRTKLCLCILSSPNPKLSKSEVCGLHQCRHGEIPSTLHNRVNALRNVGRHVTKPPTSIHVLSSMLFLYLTGPLSHSPVLSFQQTMPIIKINFVLCISSIYKELLSLNRLERQGKVRSNMPCTESTIGGRGSYSQAGSSKAALIPLCLSLKTSIPDCGVTWALK